MNLSDFSFRERLCQRRKLDERFSGKEAARNNMIEPNCGLASHGSNQRLMRNRPRDATASWRNNRRQATSTPHIDEFRIPLTPKFPQSLQGSFDMSEKERLLPDTVNEVLIYFVAAVFFFLFLCKRGPFF
jgi:hypothetical protein